MKRLRNIKDVWNKYQFILTATQKRWGIIVVLMTIVGAIFETLGVSIILPLVQVMVNPDQIRDNRILSPVIIQLNLNSDNALIWAVGLVVIIIYLAKNLFLFLLSYVRVKYACKVQRELSSEMMESYMKRGYVFFLNMGTGELIRGMRDSVSCTYTALYQIFKLMAELLTISFICIYIMLSDITMAFCVIVLAVFCLLIVVMICQKKVKKCGEINYIYTALINKELLQTFQGIKEVLVMRKQQFFIDSYKDKYQKQQKGIIGQTVATESPTYFIEAVCVMGLIVAVCIKALDSDNAAILVPQLAAFAVAAFRILPSLGRISSCFNQFMFSIPGINDTYNNFMEVRGNKGQQNDITQYNLIDSVTELKDKLAVNNVTWKYPKSDNEILKSVSLEVHKGESIAFVGKSGAGKTTLADIILGLLKPQNGEVLVDGKNISIESRSRLIGFVPQNINLLDDTVRRNVAFGIKDEEIDDDAVWTALKQAQLKTVIESSPNGLDTEIGERGIKFSGGQRQRFAIARALYSNPDILLLDEATAALDTETENAVMDAIETLQGHKTLIIIAHRLSTIKKCDTIYEITEGKILKREYEELIK